jgi:hypothetical protein
MLDLSGSKNPLAAKFLSALLSGDQSSARALHDQGPLELGERSHNVQDQASSRALRIDRVGQGFEIDPAYAEVRHNLDEMGEGSAEPVQLPYDQRVAPLERSECTNKTGSGCCGSAHPVVGVNSSTACRRECVSLNVKRLVRRRNPRIADPHDPYLEPIYRTAKALTSVGRIFVPKIIVYGTQDF